MAVYIRHRHHNFQQYQRYLDRNRDRSTAGTLGEFTLDDLMGNSGTYNLSLAITASNSSGDTSYCNIEQGGTGAKGIPPTGGFGANGTAGFGQKHLQ